MVKLFIFCYHKAGTTLFSRVFENVAREFGMRMITRYGLVPSLGVDAAEIVLFAHSLIGFDLSAHPHRGVRVIRDPRGIWVSGYYYHRRCREAWCINSDLRCSAPIRFPLIPYSQEHRSEQWKRDYMGSLNGRSYQQNLLMLDRDAGLEFERIRYTKWTTEAMAAWCADPFTIDVQLESLATDFVGTMAMLLRHLGFSGDRLDAAIRIAQAQDLAHMSKKKVADNPQVTSLNVNLWREILMLDQRRSFEVEHADLIQSLGYPLGP